jgi:hypothetical protein
MTDQLPAIIPPDALRTSDTHLLTMMLFLEIAKAPPPSK